MLDSPEEFELSNRFEQMVRELIQLCDCSMINFLTAHSLIPQLRGKLSITFPLVSWKDKILLLKTGDEVDLE